MFVTVSSVAVSHRVNLLFVVKVVHPEVRLGWNGGRIHKTDTYGHTHIPIQTHTDIHTNTYQHRHTQTDTYRYIQTYRFRHIDTYRHIKTHTNAGTYRHIQIAVCTLDSHSIYSNFGGYLGSPQWSMKTFIWCMAVVNKHWAVCSAERYTNRKWLKCSHSVTAAVGVRGCVCALVCIWSQVHTHSVHCAVLCVCVFVHWFVSVHQCTHTAYIAQYCVCVWPAAHSVLLRIFVSTEKCLCNKARTDNIARLTLLYPALHFATAVSECSS